MFGKNFIFRVKSTIFFFRTKCTFFGTKLQFLSKICTFYWNILAKTSFLEYKVQIFLGGDQMYILWYKTTVFIQNLYILVKYFGKNFIFSLKRTNFLVFQDQMLVKFFGKNFIFSMKSTIFLFFQNQMYIFGYKTTLFI